MTIESLMNTELWQEFERRARRERKQPAALLARLLRESLEVGDAARRAAQPLRRIRRRPFS